MLFERTGGKGEMEQREPKTRHAGKEKEKVHGTHPRYCFPLSRWEHNNAFSS